MADINGGSRAIPSGYDYDFVSPVDEDYVCRICHLPLKQAVLTKCGHRFCRDCLTESFRRRREPECPCDREKLDRDKDIFLDKASERRILSYMVRCPCAGCPWTGELRDVQNHEERCPEKAVECPSQHCNVHLARRLIEEHLMTSCPWKIVCCPFCGENHPKSHELAHKESCSMYPLNRMNRSTQVIPRKQSQSPVENWTDDLPVCKHSGVGFLINQRYKEDGGRREEHEFEDRNFRFNVDDKYLYGVFDGHDGPRASDFTMQRLPAELLLGQLTATMNNEQIKGAIRRAFIAVEKRFFQSLDDALAEKFELQLQMPEGLSSYEAYQKFPEHVARIQALQDEISGGTTAVLALIFQNKLFVANVGDSRALLCRETPEGNLSVQQLSVDHVTDNEEELERLANIGLDIQQIQRNRRIGSQQNTRSIGDYGVKGGYKDFDILSVATEEPVIAEPHICGGIPIDETFFALVLMSDGVYRSIVEAADLDINSNFDVVRLVVEELRCQNNLTGVAQAVVDRIGRAHHDTYMNHLRKCQKRDDMTLLIRIFKEEISNSLKSPRNAGRQTMSGVPPVSPVALPVSAPYNPSSAVSGTAPSLYIPHGVQPKQQPPGNTPSPTTSTPTCTTPVPQQAVNSSRSDNQSSASSASQSPSLPTPAESVTRIKHNQRES